MNKTQRGRLLTQEDLIFLSLGASILGSGGGGDSTYALMMAQHQLEQHRPVTLLSLEELNQEDVVVPLGIMGAPMINMERLLSGKELEAIMRMIPSRLGLVPSVVMPGEIGGANAFAPLLIAAQQGLPLLDADLLGRAFPQLQMNACYLKYQKAPSAIIADCFGNTVVIDTSSISTLETLARQICVSMGSSAAVALHVMQGHEVSGAVIPGSISSAVQMGKVVYQAQQEGRDVIAALEESTAARVLARGTLIDVRQEIQHGFLKGSVTLLSDGGTILLSYQNEYLCAQDASGILACTPDILTLIEEESGTPIASDVLKYGLRVALLVLPAPAVWKTEEGLALVGPRVFGYEIEYHSFLEIKR